MNSESSAISSDLRSTLLDQYQELIESDLPEADKFIVANADLFGYEKVNWHLWIRTYIILRQGMILERSTLEGEIFS